MGFGLVLVFFVSLGLWVWVMGMDSNPNPKTQKKQAGFWFGTWFLWVFGFGICFFLFFMGLSPDQNPCFFWVKLLIDFAQLKLSILPTPCSYFNILI